MEGRRGEAPCGPVCGVRVPDGRTAPESVAGRAPGRPAPVGDYGRNCAGFASLRGRYSSIT